MVAMVASFDCVGMADEDVGFVTVLFVVGLLLQAAASNAIEQIATTGAPLRNPRMNTYEPPLFVGCWSSDLA